MGRARQRVAAALILTAAVLIAGVTNIRELLEEGNAHYAAGRYEDALEAYNRIEPDEQGLLPAEVLHNRAAASFKLGRLEDSLDLWVRAASLKDPAFEASARYNIGNCHYSMALRSLEEQQPDRDGAIQELERAIQQYRDALQLDPGLANARANIELAARLKQELEQQRQSESQPQSQPQSQPESSSQPSEECENPGSGSGDGNQQSQSQPSSQPSQQQDQQSDEQQNQQQQQEREQNPEELGEPQSQPATQPDQSDSQRQNPSQPIEIELTDEEARRLLQLIRDAEKARREALRLRRAPTRPVEKDW